MKPDTIKKLTDSYEAAIAAARAPGATAEDRAAAVAASKALSEALVDTRRRTFPASRAGKLQAKIRRAR